ncbi:DUF3301 domain-containing protein [Proteobacteria bacterium 005FR1]|nr:DUF3301 domain-containing protein [Proteobacteria bacterium 005FR1]
MISELLLIALIVGAFAVWLHMSAVRERALAASRDYCEQMGVQFLDGSVVRTGIRITRARSGTVALAQRFQFEFTVTGERRYRGEAVFVGNRQVSMRLEPHVLH